MAIFNIFYSREPWNFLRMFKNHYFEYFQDGVDVSWKYLIFDFLYIYTEKFFNLKFFLEKFWKISRKIKLKKLWKNTKLNSYLLTRKLLGLILI